MGCRFCDNENIIKSGKVRNKQRYHCKSCGKYYINELSIRGYNNQIKLQAIELVTEGVSFRGDRKTIKSEFKYSIKMV
jgi:transposase-like protein